CITHRGTSKFFEQLSDRDEVAFRLRHFPAFHLQEAVVHPEGRHDRRMERAARLRDLIFMVRKDEIDAATVDVENLPEMLPTHSRAFNVPTGPPMRCNACRRRPIRFPRLRWLP